MPSPLYTKGKKGLGKRILGPLLPVLSTNQVGAFQSHDVYVKNALYVQGFVRLQGIAKDRVDMR